ncbi:hypothetical protein [Janthinobacterium sp. 1_2014MBL_MicDiv]|uniref:hypothetical protein n=1 Tax=Janthinobacterium sp. 1_2014MBL_MicDiv TaxID=1644131 RepID=UPI0008F4CBFF|nr:hypothetical protein [Janthinobacterium sp. 1_2014MBL_MicDiv]APA68579.1 hypothetical protein YQ44_13025 [Janthinobacterium sp. 1_2014MBL_MicDiv]
MKTIILGTLLCLAAASTAATAQTLAPEHTVTVPGNSLRIDVPDHPRYMMRQDFKKFVGAYDLSNGDTLELRLAGAVMYARIGKQDEHRIVATDRNAFVALDRQLKVRIDHNDDGSIDGELVMVLPSQKLSGGDIVPSRVQNVGLASR